MKGIIKYFIIFFSALILEIGSTMYINSVADKNLLNSMFWAFIGPFIALPFTGFIADEKTWSGRFLLASSSALGYTTGALISIHFILLQ
jgi:hypothetical protein